MLGPESEGSLGLLRSLDKLSAARRLRALSTGTSVAAMSTIAYGFELLNGGAPARRIHLPPRTSRQGWARECPLTRMVRSARAPSAGSANGLNGVMTPRELMNPRVDRRDRQPVASPAYHLGAIRQINALTRGLPKPRRVRCDPPFALKKAPPDII